MALIKTPAELKPYLPVPYANTINGLPDFSEAEERYLIPIIGMPLYESLQGETLSINLTALLKKCQAVIAPFGYLGHVDFLQVQLSDNGLMAVEATNARKAYKWELNNMKRALTNMGYSRMELLISFLHAHSADYPTWSQSAYNAPDFAIIRNGMELAASITINQPHRSFMALKPLFIEVGELTIESALGKEYYADLNSRILSDQLTEHEAGGFMRSLRMASSRFAMAKAVRTMNVQFDPASGFTILDSSKDTADEGRKNAGNIDLTVLAREQELSAAAFLNKVKETLNSKASDAIFPVYFASSTYTNPHVSANKTKNIRTGMFTTR